MNFLKNLFGILGTLISVWGLFIILDAMGSRSEGAWVDPAGFRAIFGYIILIPGLIMLGLWWLIGRFVAKTKDIPAKNEVEHGSPKEMNTHSNSRAKDER